MSNTDPVLKHVWIAPLLARYRAVLTGPDRSNQSIDKQWLRHYNGLRLADAVLDKLALQQTAPQHPVQVTIVGPTQAGKSTLVNLLLQTSAAGISPLAGYTVHAQGFAVNCDSTELDALDSVMAPLQRVSLAQLSADQLNRYSLDVVSTGNSALLEHGVVWDSPDFDSIESHGYRGAVLASIAIADVLILMLSKDKYGDKSVWDMLALIHELGKPIIICINKLSPNDTDTVLNAFTERHQQQFDRPPPAIVTLPFVPAGSSSNSSMSGAVNNSASSSASGSTSHAGNTDATITLPADQLQALGNTLNQALSAVDRQSQGLRCNEFIESHKQNWLAPLIDELDATARWQALIDEALESADELYYSAYLENPDKYETFNRALAELLNLLEIPGVATALARTRKLVTWPARKLFGFGKQQLQKPFGHSDADQSQRDQEEQTLKLMLKQTMTQLQGALIEQREESPEQARIWQALNTTFRTQREAISARYEKESIATREEFAPRIDAAAASLYEQLQQQPVLLNTLRAARVTTDAAGVALAVKSGGLAPADLILAPAMLSITSLLTESALGRYIESVKRDLKREQREHIKQRLLLAVLQHDLNALIEQCDDSSLLSSRLDSRVKQVIDEIPA